MAAWVEGRVAGKRHWTQDLFSLQVAAPDVKFVAGQFGRLALPAPPGHKEPMIGRPYSFVNPPHEQPHEFYFIVVPGGPLTPRLAALEVGDPVWLAPRANGFFSIGEVAQADVLWCLSTGTGHRAVPVDAAHRRALGASSSAIVLVHAVRHARGTHLSRRDRGYRPRARRRVHVRADREPRGASGCARGAHPGGDRGWPARGAGRDRAVAGELARDAVRQSGDGRGHAEAAARRAGCAGTGGRSRGTSPSRPIGDIPSSR